MPTSVICRRTRPRCRQGPSSDASDFSFRDDTSPRYRPRTRESISRASGFTLIELLVALVLLGLLSAVAIPNLERIFGGIDRTTGRDRIVDQIAGLGRRAVLERSAFVVMSSTHDPNPAADAFADEVGDAGDAPSASEDIVHFGETPGDRFVRYPLELPPSWEVRLDPPLLIRSNGVCLGSELTLLHEGEEIMRFTLAPPYCELNQENDPANSPSENA